MMTRCVKGFGLLLTCAAFAVLALAQPSTATPAPKRVRAKTTTKHAARKRAVAKHKPEAKPRASKTKRVAAKPKPAAPAAAAQPPVAVVDGKPITRAEMLQYGYSDYGRKILGDMMDDVLIRRAAAKDGVKVTPEEIHARIEGLGGVDAAVAKRGLSGPAALRRQIETELLLGKIVEAENVVTDKQAREYYDAHKSDYQTPGRDHLYEIVTNQATAAYDARKRVSQGESFDKVAREVSSGPDASKGGDMGWVTLADMHNDILRNVAATLKIGEISTPLLVDGKFYILMVTEKELPKSTPFAQAKPQIIEKVRADRGATPQAVLEKLRRQAKVEVLAPEYKYIEGQMAQARKVKVTANGAPVEMHLPAVMQSGHLMAPAKEIFKAMHCVVQWVPASKTMVIHRGKQVVRVTVGSDVAFVNGQATAMGIKAELRSGTVYAPPRPIAEGLGIKVKWIPVEYRLDLRSK